jgi:mono/diheme cytochrome c family protein
MYRFPVALIILALSLPWMARADHLDVTLKADPALVESGLMKFLLPRFSLKTGIRLHLSPDAPDVTLTRSAGPDARPVLKGPKQLYFITLTPGASEKSTRFADWLLEDVGQRTIDQFRKDGAQIYIGAADAAPEIAEAVPEGDTQNGERLSYARCGRCHVVGPANRMKGIGSTPSFALMRGFPDWQRRFQGFYALNPHPSFSQITDVTPAFDPALPPAINPLELTQAELDDIVAFVAGIKPADLGAPLQTQ